MTDGYVSGINPLTPLLPETSPKFGHKRSFAVGQIAGSLQGLALDAVSIGAGVVGLAAETGVAVLSGGAAAAAVLPPRGSRLLSSPSA